ncbi:MAG: ATP synthase F1 subunit gamma [Lachnospiraceae bacterium]|nr:ATP synthase F1 subunit gamma [Lachnospiraceae bacterium]
MASMRDIKRRKGSISSTQQITKAMKLVATVKLQKSKTQAEEASPYFLTMFQTVQSILERTGKINHPYLDGRPDGKKAVVLISSNRGLAGGYNSNVAKLITEGDFETENTLVYCIGKKGREYVERRGYSIMKEASDIINHPLYSDAISVCNELMEKFQKGEIGEIYVAYTFFKNTVSHEPTLLKLLPISDEDAVDKLEEEDMEEEDPYAKLTPMNYEPSEEEALNMIIPKYITSIFFGALMQAAASENGARMQAMDAATSNAQEMIDKLSLQYNRARQGSITQELTEIIAGADALT